MEDVNKMARRVSGLRKKTLSFRRNRRYDLENAKENVMKKFPSFSAYTKVTSPASVASSNATLVCDNETSEACIRQPIRAYESFMNLPSAVAIEVRSNDRRQDRTEAKNPKTESDEQSLSGIMKGKLSSLKQKMRASTRYRSTKLINSPGTPGFVNKRRSIRIQNRTPLKTVVSTDGNSSVKLNRFKSQRRMMLSPGQFNRKIDAVTKGIQSLSKLGDGITTKIQKQASRIKLNPADGYRMGPMTRQLSYRTAVTASTETLLS